MRHLSLFLLLTCAVSVSGQIFETNFPSYSVVYSVAPTSDGNYISVGSKGVYANDIKVWVFKTDPAGQILWEKTYAISNGNSFGRDILQLPGGDLMVVGGGGNYSTYDNGFVLRISSDGAPKWVKNLGSAIYGISKTSDNYFLLGGSNGNTEDGVVIKMAENGNIVWEKNYHFSSFDGFVMRTLPQPDGTFYALGRGDVTGAGFRGIFLVHADSNGEPLWQKDLNTGNYQNSYLNSQELGPLGAVQNAAGEIIVAEGSGNGYGSLRAFSAQGEKIWEKFYGTAENDMSFFCLTQDADGNLYAGGNIWGVGNGKYSVLVKTTAAGSEIWTRIFEKPGRNAIGSIQLRNNSTCLIAGYGTENQYSTGYLAGLDADGYLSLRSVAITLKRDLNNDCQSGAADQPLANWPVELKSANSSILVFTDENGQAGQSIPDGEYELIVHTPSASWASCSPVQTLNVDPAGGASVFYADLTVHAVKDCPAPTVSVTAPDLLRCGIGKYYVECSNAGSVDFPQTKVLVTLDHSLQLESASLPYTFANGKYAFDLGSLPPLGLKRFSITARLSCDVEIGQTYCLDAEIADAPACALPASANWSGASLKVAAECLGGDVRFTFTNKGSADMEDPLEYQLFADGWEMQTDVVLLNAGESYSFNYPAEGRSVWVKAPQIPGHPGQDRPAVGWEGCGLTSNGFASTGFLDMFEHNERDPHRSTICVENMRRTFDSRITGVPEGYGWYHLIPFDLAPEYLVRFNNTTQTATQSVKVRVTLSPMVDPNSFSVTAASADYTVRVVSAGVFDVNFSAMALPPASQDSLASWGFLRFRTQQPAVVDTGARIINTAQVYFNNESFSDPRLAYHFSVPEGFGEATFPSPYSDQDGLKVFAGSSLFDFAGDVVHNPDGTMFILTSTFSYGNNYDLVLIKTDQNGRGIWQKVYDFDGGDVFYYAVSDGEGGLVATGYQDDPAIAENYLEDAYLPIVRIDANGNVLWYRREKPGTGDLGRGGEGFGITRSSDGNFVVTGILTNYPASSSDNFLLKVDPQGNTVWFHNYLIPGVAFSPSGVTQTSDGGYIMCGNDEGDWPLSIRIQKVDAGGETQWVKTHPYEYDVTPNGMSHFALLSDESIIWAGALSGYDADSNYTNWVVLTKLDASGNFLWRKTLDINFPLSASRVLATAHDGCMVTGEAYLGGGLSAIFLLEVDEQGDLKWFTYEHVNTTTYGIALKDRGNGKVAALAQTQTNNYLYNLGAVLMLAKADGTLNLPEKPALVDNALAIWPNPADRYFHAALTGQSRVGPYSWKLLDPFGRVLLEGESADPAFTVQTSGLPAGAYQLAVYWTGGQAVHPVVIRGR